MLEQADKGLVRWLAGKGPAGLHLLPHAHVAGASGPLPVVL